MANKIEALAFDLEGTIVDVEFAHHQAHILSAKDVGIILSLENCFKLLPHFIGGPDEKVAEDISALAAQRGLGTIDPKYVLKQKRAYYHKLLSELPIQPRAGFIEFFQAIKKMGLKYAIGSLTDEIQAKILLERSGIRELFGDSNIILREHVKNLKPAPDVWIETARRTGINPANQLIFEDSPRGIQGAMQIGAYCIGMPVYNRPDLINSLSEAGAKRIFIFWNEIDPYYLIKNVNEERARK